MRDQHQRQVSEAAISRLETGQLHELVGTDDDRRDSEGLQQDGAVDTPRRAGPSVSAPDEHEIAAREISDHCR